MTALLAPLVPVVTDAKVRLRRQLQLLELRASADARACSTRVRPAAATRQQAGALWRRIICPRSRRSCLAHARRAVPRVAGAFAGWPAQARSARLSARRLFLTRTRRYRLATPLRRRAALRSRGAPFAVRRARARLTLFARLSRRLCVARVATHLFSPDSGPSRRDIDASAALQQAAGPPPRRPYHGRCVRRRRGRSCCPARRSRRRRECVASLAHKRVTSMPCFHPLSLHCSVSGADTAWILTSTALVLCAYAVCAGNVCSSLLVGSRARLVALQSCPFQGSPSSMRASCAPRTCSACSSTASCSWQRAHSRG